jgi:hypothetical protein
MRLKLTTNNFPLKRLIFNYTYQHGSWTFCAKNLEHVTQFKCNGQHPNFPRDDSDSSWIRMNANELLPHWGKWTESTQFVFIIDAYKQHFFALGLILHVFMHGKELRLHLIVKGNQREHYFVSERFLTHFFNVQNDPLSLTLCMQVYRRSWQFTAWSDFQIKIAKLSENTFLYHVMFHRVTFCFYN